MSSVVTQRMTAYLARQESFGFTVGHYLPVAMLKCLPVT